MKQWNIIKNLTLPCNNCEKKNVAGFETKFNDNKANGKVLRLCVGCLQELRVKTDNANNRYKAQKSPYLNSSDMLI